MPQNFEPARRADGRAPLIRYYIGHKSAVDNVGDPLVLTTAAAETTSSYPVARKLLAADVTASYLQGGVIGGLLGFLAASYYSTSGGAPTSQPAAGSASAAGQPVLQIPQYGAGIPVDENISYGKMKVWVADDSAEFWGKLGGGGTTTATAALVGTRAGIDISGSGSTAIFTVDTSESSKPLQITGWDPLDTTRVKFKVLKSFQQIEGVPYTSQ